MAIVHESSASAASATCNKPTGTASGDVLVGVVLAAHNADAACTGWTARISADYAGSIRLTVLTRVVDGSEGASFTFTGGTVYDTGISRYSGVDTTAVVEGIATSAAGAATTAVPASITTVTNGAELVLAGGLYVSGGTSSDDLTYSGAMTEHWQVELSNLIMAGLASETIATAGATGTRTVTAAHTGGTAVTFGAMLALVPADTGTIADAVAMTGTYALPVPTLAVSDLVDVPVAAATFALPAPTPVLVVDAAALGAAFALDAPTVAFGFTVDAPALAGTWDLPVPFVDLAVDTPDLAATFALAAPELTVTQLVDVPVLSALFDLPVPFAGIRLPGSRLDAGARSAVIPGQTPRGRAVPRPTENVTIIPRATQERRR